MISIRRISLGGGFRYLMESVARGDGAPEPSTPLAAYYAASGTPPGRFVGGGLAALDDGRGVERGSEVSEKHLWNMLGVLCDPVSGDPVGSTPRAGTAAPVAGFDLTFSPPKSVSTVWALSDEATRKVIYDCHRRAIDHVLAYGEGRVFHSRSGANGVVEEDVDGVVAAAFTHWESRAGDPQLHDHVVVWNRAPSTSDGRWRTLDSRGLYKAVVALSEIHHGVLSDYLTEALGLGWDARGRQHSSRPRWEIAGVPEVLVAEFSTRSAQVEARADELIDEFLADHGRQPKGGELLNLRRFATIETRPDKQHRTLADMTEGWRTRASDHVEGDQVAWVSGLKGRNDLPLLRSVDLGDEILEDAAGAVVDTVAERHATYSRYNLVAEAHRTIQGVRFTGPDERIAVAERITDLAIERSLTLTAPALHHTPDRYLRPDGTSRLRPTGHLVFTTQVILDAEARLLDAGRRTDAPTVSSDIITGETVVTGPGYEIPLSADQIRAVTAIATSGRAVDVLIGPAGTGKSATMADLRRAWEAERGPGSVVGLAPSAAAAQVLAVELGIATENTAKWLTEHRRAGSRQAERDQTERRLATITITSGTATGLRNRVATIDKEIERWQFRAGQLVIVDEATLAGTLSLDELVATAGDAGAKVLLVGDWAQLSAVDAGGAFGLLTRDRADMAPQLTDVHRFRSAWEKEASVALRPGREAAIDAYEARERVAGGTRDEMLGAVYAAWSDDVGRGKSSLMIAPDLATVVELNRRARADLVSSGTVAEEGLPLRGDQTAGVGDEVVTRRNDRLTATGQRWVRNGDRWLVTASNPDGTMTVRRADGNGQVTLAADYVAEHVELGYASTVHRAQGTTVDTAHAMISPTSTREGLYVAATRGREANRLYVDTAFDPDPQTGHDHQDTPPTARDVLVGVLANTGAERSAHETLREAIDDAESWATLCAEYQTIAQAAQADRWDGVLERSGLTAADLDRVRSSPAQGPLLAAFRTAESSGLDIHKALPHLVRGRPISGADDVASVLHARVERWAQTAGSRRQATTNMIAGLIPRALNITEADLGRALDDRERAMERRAQTLAVQALEEPSCWARHLGTPPPEPSPRRRWLGAITTVAAYRDRWGITGDLPLGPDLSATSTEQLGQRQRATTAARNAIVLAQPADLGAHHTAQAELQYDRTVEQAIDL